MKRILTFALLFGSIACVQAASESGKKSDSIVNSPREWESYQDTGYERSMELTLSGTAGTISTVTVPSFAKGFRIYPRSNHVRFAIRDSGNPTDTNIAAVAASSVLVITATDTARGGIAKADGWETRLLPSTGSDRFLYLRSTTVSVVIDLEFF